MSMRIISNFLWRILYIYLNLWLSDEINSYNKPNKDMALGRPGTRGLRELPSLFLWSSAQVLHAVKRQFISADDVQNSRKKKSLSQISPGLGIWLSKWI